MTTRAAGRRALRADRRVWPCRQRRSTIDEVGPWAKIPANIGSALSSDHNPASSSSCTDACARSRAQARASRSSRAARDERQRTTDRDVGVNPDEGGVPMFAGIPIQIPDSSNVARRFRHGLTAFARGSPGHGAAQKNITSAGKPNGFA
jgi:hypothetical protein